MLLWLERGEGGRKDWTDGGREGGLDRGLEGRGRERENQHSFACNVYVHLRVDELPCVAFYVYVHLRVSSHK